jgi:hypothetical protein
MVRFARHDGTGVASGRKRGKPVANVETSLSRLRKNWPLLRMAFHQGLKPILFSATFGMTEVMPCYKTGQELPDWTAR